MSNKLVKQNGMVLNSKLYVIKCQTKNCCSQIEHITIATFTNIEAKKISLKIITTIEHTKFNLKNSLQPTFSIYL